MAQRRRSSSQWDSYRQRRGRQAGKKNRYFSNLPERQISASGIGIRETDVSRQPLEEINSPVTRFATEQYDIPAAIDDLEGFKSLRNEEIIDRIGSGELGKGYREDDNGINGEKNRKTDADANVNSNGHEEDTLSRKLGKYKDTLYSQQSDILTRRKGRTKAGKPRRAYGESGFYSSPDDARQARSAYYSASDESPSVVDEIVGIDPAAEDYTALNMLLDEGKRYEIDPNEVLTVPTGRGLAAPQQAAVQATNNALQSLQGMIAQRGYGGLTTADGRVVPAEQVARLEKRLMGYSGPQLPNISAEEIKLFASKEFDELANPQVRDRRLTTIGNIDRLGPTYSDDFGVSNYQFYDEPVTDAVRAQYLKSNTPSQSNANAPKPADVRPWVLQNMLYGANDTSTQDLTNYRYDTSGVPINETLRTFGQTAQKQKVTNILRNRIKADNRSGRPSMFTPDQVSLLGQIYKTGPRSINETQLLIDAALSVAKDNDMKLMQGARMQESSTYGVDEALNLLGLKGSNPQARMDFATALSQLDMAQRMGRSQTGVNFPWKKAFIMRDQERMPRTTDVLFGTIGKSETPLSKFPTELRQAMKDLKPTATGDGSIDPMSKQNLTALVDTRADAKEQASLKMTLREIDYQLSTSPINKPTAEIIKLKQLKERIENEIKALEPVNQRSYFNKAGLFNKGRVSWDREQNMVDQLSNPYAKPGQMNLALGILDRAKEGEAAMQKQLLDQKIARFMQSTKPYSEVTPSPMGASGGQTGMSFGDQLRQAQGRLTTPSTSMIEADQDRQLSQIISEAKKRSLATDAYNELRRIGLVQ